jgi:hypothetical protein
MLSSPRDNSSDTNMSEESNMSDKKRRTVKTIETHEVWIVRKVVPSVADEAETLVPLEIPQTPASPLSEVNRSQTIEDES